MNLLFFVLHLDSTGPSCACISCSCTGSSLRIWCRLVISGGVRGVLRISKLEASRLLDQFDEIVRRAQAD
jgi:hypothetical protein